MAGPDHKEITQMGWAEFEDQLQPAARGARRGGPDEKALREYFGDQAFEQLQELARRSRATRSGAAPLGNIILLPGIMGSTLTTREGGDDDIVWVNLLRLAAGRITRLRLSPDGRRDADGRVKVSPTGVDKRTYSRAVLKLRARWEVEPFAFDWRKDIDDASDGLARFIKERFEGRPVHLVAHSMGGLVARNFIRRHRGLWDKMSGDGGQGGRLVMLGTPNYGSFAIPQVLTGVERLVGWLAKLDLTNSLNEVLGVISTFVGSYQMLPAPDKAAPAVQTLYSREIWGPLSVSQEHLNRAREFHEGLKDPATINPERMAYIAGCNRTTLAGLEVIAPGEFRYFETAEGDGRVPFTLGLLDGVPTYYVDEDHGSLPKNERVLAAVEELLQHGATALLPERPLVPRAAAGTGGRWHRPMGEHRTGSALEDYAERAAAGNLTPDEQRAAEETVMRAALGEERPERELTEVRQKTAPRAVPRAALHLEVVKGDVTQVEAPVVVVGQYSGVTPVNAVGALDKALDHWISRAIKFSMVDGGLGRLFFIPVKHGQIAAESVLLAGMGEEGKFGQDDLRYLMLNVTYAISALEAESFATVLIGSGAGNLKEERAIRGMLFGICDALHRLPAAKRLKRVIIVEKDGARHRQIAEVLEVIKAEDSAANLDIKVTERRLKAPPAKRAAREAEPPAELQEVSFGPRVTIERAGDLFRFSALTRTAVVPVREVEIQSFFPDRIAERLMRSATRYEQQQLGRLLHTAVIPEDFGALFDTAEPLTLILDRSTAAIPWEMACFNTPAGTAFFGTHLSLARQFRTLLAAAPGIAPPLNETLRVLVIADPAPEPEYQLPGARLEGRAVARVLSQIKQEGGLQIDVVARIGDAECDPVEILGLILEGGFDVVHYAGHGVFDEANPAHGGWVFGADCRLSAREIFRARRVPRVVFANACFSAVVNPGKPITAAELNRHLAGIAEAFFERGVQNYIGAGWPVRDDLAVRFATAFYENALTGRTLNIFPGDSNSGAGRPKPPGSGVFSPATLGEALADARKLIIHDGSTWGAYQHYGHPGALLMPKGRASRPGRARENKPGVAGRGQKTASRAKGARTAGRKRAQATAKNRKK